MSHYKPYPAYKDSGVEWLGEVPEHWGVKPLKLLVKEGSTISYGIVQPGEPLDEGVPFVQTTNMSSGNFEIESLQKTTSEIAAGFPRSRLTGGEVILGIRASIGAAFVVPVHLAGVNLSRGVARIDCSSELSSRFLVAYLSSMAVDGYWQLAKQGSTFNEVSIATVKELLVPVPPSEEQADIEGVLSNATARLDALIEKKTRFINLLREKRQALITHAVTKGLDPNVRMKDSGVQWLGEVPEHWELRPLKRLISSIGQGWSPECEARTPEEGEWGVVKVGCVNGGVFRPEESKALPAEMEPRPELSLRAGDVLISRANTRELVGSCAVVPCDYPYLLLCDKLYRVGCSERVTPDFLAALVTVYGRRAVEIEATGASSSMVNIAQSVILDLPVAVPGTDEQVEIISRVSEATARIERLREKTERSIDLLKERRSALITAAVTGQIDLREAV